MAERENLPWTNRQFDKGLSLEFCEVRGNGGRGYWLFKASGEERVGGTTQPVEFSIQFMPATMRYLRVFSSEPIDSDVVSADLAQRFEMEIREAARKRSNRIRANVDSRRGPAAMLQNLGAILVMQGFMPDENIILEIQGRINAYINTAQHKHLVKRCKTEDYHFGDTEVGRFFMKERPPMSI